MENIINEKQSLRDWIKEAEATGRALTYRADPIVSSTDSGVVEKQVFPGIDVLQSPAEAFLRKLGVTFFPGLVGNFVVPAMAEDTGAFYTEYDVTVDSSAVSANMATSSITLAARRISHTQAISKETLAQTSNAVYDAIAKNLYNGVWNAVTYDLFDQVELDASNACIKIGATVPITFTNIVNMEASLGGRTLLSPAYVVTPANRAFLATTQKMTNQEGIWNNDKINGYPAYAVPAANVHRTIFADWSKTCVGQWGSLELVVDPFTDAKKGLINLTISGLFDTGCFNKRGLTFYYDPSTN